MSPILGRFHFSAVTPTPLPSCPSRSRFLGARGSPGPEKRFCPRGIRQARTLQETTASRWLSEATSQPPTSRSSAPPGFQGRRTCQFCPGRRPKCGPFGSQSVVLRPDLEIPVARPLTSSTLSPGHVSFPGY